VVLIHRHLANGNVRKAANCIEAAPLARPTLEVMQELQRLHHQEAPPPIPQVEASPILLTEEHLSAALYKTGKGKAGGPRGWTYEHVWAIVQEGPATMSSVLHLANALVAGPLPRSPPSSTATSSRYASATAVFARLLSKRCGSTSLACACWRPAAPMGWRPFSLASECRAALKPSATPFEPRSAPIPQALWCVSTVQTPSILCCVAACCQ
jgi:hypothetical protein